MWFPEEATGGARQAGLGLANMNTFRRIWGTEAALSCLVLSPGLGPQCLIKDIIGDMGSDW